MPAQTSNLPQQEQEQVKDWFNQVYRDKGERYLRPSNAYSLFLELLQAKPGQKLLDVACGLGNLLLAAEEYQCQLHGIDISDVAIGKAKSRLPQAQLSTGNAEALPHGDQEFDLVTCLGSLERMLDLDQVLAELSRVGHAQTRYCFLVRNANTLSWRILKQGLGMRNRKGHQGAKSLLHWQTVFAQAGFSVELVLPDQYPLHKRKQWLTLGLYRPDHRRILNSWLPLTYANEFIFLLRKSAS